MKRADAERAAILVQALAELDDVAAALREPKRESYDYRGLMLWAGDIGRGGDVGNGANTAIDAATGALLLPIVRKIIEDELVKLGVEP